MRILEIMEFLLYFTTLTTMANIQGEMLQYGSRDYLISHGSLPSADSQEPSFDVPVVNITATIGMTAILPCTINSLRDRKVLWMDPRGKALTMADRRVIFDQRISLERPVTRDWNLHIRSVKHSDSGEYMCQINTSPVKIKKVLLYVFEPAKIDGHMSAGDQVIQEGQTVTLWCNATGIPPPRVTWFRKSIHNKHAAKEAIGNEGEILRIHNITRYCADVYECVAFNDIEPADSREMKVTVESNGLQPSINMKIRYQAKLDSCDGIVRPKVEARNSYKLCGIHEATNKLFAKSALQNQYDYINEYADRTRLTTTSTSTMSNSIFWVMPPERPYTGMHKPNIIQPIGNGFSYDPAKSKTKSRNQSRTISSVSYHRIVQLTVCVILFVLMTR